jgi:hypothetical protein
MVMIAVYCAFHKGDGSRRIKLQRLGENLKNNLQAQHFAPKAQKLNEKLNPEPSFRVS